ncbi:hypothetical protein ANO11243_018800 [Dothideomycetidae sp. 11243]|nr:hypothetical protein ANO11243_018800 [fungal sp. No.11243]
MNDVKMSQKNMPENLHDPKPDRVSSPLAQSSGRIEKDNALKTGPVCTNVWAMPGAVLGVQMHDGRYVQVEAENSSIPSEEIIRSAMRAKGYTNAHVEEAMAKLKKDLDGKGARG